ncbi:MAG TPA: DUF3667 domain-containing protein, partial [Saprospiraceae bacterium]|nr:DUF3667 domain-containing protein [Saprospiraceae bacterium]
MFEGKFCPNCGQKASIRRLTFSLLVEEFVHIFTHIEHGFLFTSWRFFAHPGQSSIEYISGKRNAYQKPVSYFLIWTGLYILTHNAIIHYRHLALTTETIAQLNIREQSNLLFRQHFTLFILPVILLSAWLLYLILGRRKYNFIEILTLSLYGGGT